MELKRTSRRPRGSQPQRGLHAPRPAFMCGDGPSDERPPPRAERPDFPPISRPARRSVSLAKRVKKDWRFTMQSNEIRIRSRRISIAARIVAAIVVVGLGIVATPAFACTFSVAGFSNAEGNARLRWEPVPGASWYEVYVQTLDSALMFAGTTTGGQIDLLPETTDPRQHAYTVVARTKDSSPVCVGETRVMLTGDPLYRLTERKIIPLVGSVRGANGSDFRTSLTLSKVALRKGTIVFRPTGTVASDADPFIRFAFEDNGTGPSELHWDDIVAAIGATGTGSLEIIPDVTGAETQLRVPPVSARVYNVAEKGTFGSRADAVWPAEWFLNPATQHSSVGIFVPAAHGNIRRSIGFRSLTPVLYRVVVFTPGEAEFQARGSAPGGYTVFSSLDAFVGKGVAPNAQVYVDFFDGYAIGFYTETDNVTNDPTLIVDTPAERQDVVSWPESPAH